MRPSPPWELPCGDFPLQAGGQDLQVRPVVGPRPLGEPAGGVGQGRRLQCPGEVGHHPAGTCRSWP